MSDNILSLIYTFSKKFRDPKTNLRFEPKNNNITAIVKDGNVNVFLQVSSNETNLYKSLLKLLKDNIEKIPGVLSVNIALTSEKNDNKPEKKFNIQTKNIIAVASGKGGVGKSTFSVNLAVALKTIGMKVGLLDADIYGPSIPRMMGISKKPIMNENKKLIPVENYGIKCMSIGFILDEDAPTIWRGPMVMKALEQMFNGVEWGELDYLIIDLPPGTGDVQLTLCQKIPVSGAVIVTTPQDISLIDARKGLKMFEKVEVPVLGIIENMSTHVCKKCGHIESIFGEGGGEQLASEAGVKLLGELPLEKQIREEMDKGTPTVSSNPMDPASIAYREIARKMAATLSMRKKDYSAAFPKIVIQND